MAAVSHRREELIDRLTDHVLDCGLESATLRPLAAAIGTSDRMLLYYFADKTELMTAVLWCAAARLTACLEAAIPADGPLPADRLRDEVWELVRAPDMVAYMRLWFEIVGRAARGEQPFRTVGEAIGRGFLAWVESRLAIADPARRAREARLLLATVEGLALFDALGLGEATVSSA